MSNLLNRIYKFLKALSHVPLPNELGKEAETIMYLIETERLKE